MDLPNPLYRVYTETTSPGLDIAYTLSGKNRGAKNMCVLCGEYWEDKDVLKYQGKIYCMPNGCAKSMQRVMTHIASTPKRAGRGR
jgi:hypothetical protein